MPPQPGPKLTIPTNSTPPLFMHAIGPPESPTHASLLDLAAFPAQICLVVKERLLFFPYCEESTREQFLFDIIVHLSFPGYFSGRS